MTDSTIFTRIDAIAMGCFFALNKDEIVKRLRDYWTKIFYFSFIALFFLRYFPYLADKVHLKFIFVPLGVNTGTIANLLIALILMYSIFGKRGIWFKILNLKLLNYIGLLSYSIYLWQQIFLNRTPYWINQFPQNIILTLLVSMGSYYLIEKRFLKLKSKFTSQGMMNTKSSKLETNKPSIITISTD